MKSGAVGRGDSRWAKLDPLVMAMLEPVVNQDHAAQFRTSLLKERAKLTHIQKIMEFKKSSGEHKGEDASKVYGNSNGDDDGGGDDDDDADDDDQEGIPEDRGNWRKERRG